MGLKMPVAKHIVNGVITIVRPHEIKKGSPLKKNLFCFNCETKTSLSHVDRHKKLVMKGVIYVRPFFKLKKGHKHGFGCRFDTLDFIKKRIFARDSEPALLKDIGNDQFEYRLHIICTAFEVLAGTIFPEEPGNPKPPPPGKEYFNVGHLPSYLKTMNQIMRLRAESETHKELQKYIVIDYNGIKINWLNFYFEYDKEDNVDKKERYDELVEYIGSKGKEKIHPLCVQGVVDTINRQFQCIQLHTPSYDDKKRVVDGIKEIPCVQVSIKDFNLFNQLTKKITLGTEIAVCALWQLRPAPLTPYDNYKIKWMNVKCNIYNQEQICVVEI